jgi:DNA-binding beta-propeller fold protein YncE
VFNYHANAYTIRIKIQSMLGKYKFNAQALLSLSVLGLILVVVVGYILFAPSNNSSKHNYQTELTFADSTKGKVYLTNAAGKILSKAVYPKYSYLNFQAVAPNGGVLASIGTGSGNESLIFTRDNAIKTYSGASAKLISSAPLLQTSHQIFFTDEKSIIFLACTDSDVTCWLQKMDLSTEKATKLLDTGVKQTNKYVPAAYLAGYNSAKQLAYVRLANIKSKLGSSTNAIYEIDIAHSKVTRSFDMPMSAIYASALSPDGKYIAFTTSDTNNKAIINILSLEKKSVQKIAWDKGVLFTGTGALNWSADSTKLLVRSFNVNVSSDASSAKAQTPIVIAYVDVSKDLKLHTIGQVSDPAHQTVSSLGWLSNDQIVYQIKKSATGNIANAVNQTVKQDTKGGTATPLLVPAGDLLQPIFY